MKKIAYLKTPNILGLIGCVTSSEPFFLICEYVPYGTLQRLLREMRGNVSLKRAFL